MPANAAAVPEARFVELFSQLSDTAKAQTLEYLQAVERASARGRLMQYSVGILLAATKQGKLPAGNEAEVMVEVLTQPETLKVLAGDRNAPDPLLAARLRGIQVKHDLLNADEPALTTEQVATCLGISRQAVDKRRRSGKLLAVSLGKRGYHYPALQFVNGTVLEGLDRVLAALAGFDPWTQLMFLRTGDPRLDDRTPLECLQAGEGDLVVWAANCYGEHSAA